MWGSYFKIIFVWNYNSNIFWPTSKVRECCILHLWILVFMGVIWWVTEYLMPSPTFWNGFCISIFIFVLWSFLLDSTHIQIILSMYSIHRMRGNRNQTVNTVKREIFAAIKFCGFDHKAVLVRFNFAGFPLLYVEHNYMEQNICGRFNLAMGNMSSTCKFQYIFLKNIQCTTLNNVLRQPQWPSFFKTFGWGGTCPQTPQTPPPPEWLRAYGASSYSHQIFL